MPEDTSTGIIELELEPINVENSLEKEVENVNSEESIIYPLPSNFYLFFLNLSLVTLPVVGLSKFSSAISTFYDGRFWRGILLFTIALFPVFQNFDALKRQMTHRRACQNYINRKNLVTRREFYKTKFYADYMKRTLAYTAAFNIQFPLFLVLFRYEQNSYLTLLFHLITITFSSISIILAANINLNRTMNTKISNLHQIRNQNEPIKTIWTEEKLKTLQIVIKFFNITAILIISSLANVAASQFLSQVLKIHFIFGFTLVIIYSIIFQIMILVPLTNLSHVKNHGEIVGLVYWSLGIWQSWIRLPNYFLFRFNVPVYNDSPSSNESNLEISSNKYYFYYFVNLAQFIVLFLPINLHNSYACRVKYEIIHTINILNVVFLFFVIVTIASTLYLQSYRNCENLYFKRCILHYEAFAAEHRTLWVILKNFTNRNLGRFMRKKITTCPVPPDLSLI